MSDESKFDLSETDRVLQQLRAQISGRLQGQEEPAASTDAFSDPNQTDPADEELTDDDELLSEVLESLASDTEGEEESTPDDGKTTNEAAEEATAPETQTPSMDEEQPPLVATEPGVSAPAAAEEIAPLLQEQSNTVARDEDLPQAKTDAPAVSTDVPVQAAPKRRRRSRKMPKLADVERQGEEQEPMLDSALEEKKQRAAELAREQDGDLYWRAMSEKNERNAYKAFAPTVDEPIPQKAPAAATKKEELRSAKPKSEEQAPIRAKATPGEREEIANLTVEGLLQDIFGKMNGPAGRAWVHHEEDVEQAGESKTQIEETVEELVISATQPVVSGEPQEQPLLEEPEQMPDDGVTLECDGQRIIFPMEDQQGRSRTAENEERIKLFSAFSAKRMPKNETELPKPTIKSMSAKRRAFKQTLEDSEEDFKLLVDLDYEDELGHVIGFEKIRDYHERRVNGQLRLSGRTKQNKRRFEYGSHTQDIDLCKYYAKQRKHRIINLIIVSFLMVFMFVYEHSASILSLFGASETTRYPIAYVVLGLCLLAVAVFFFRRRLLEGMLALCHLSVSDASFAFITVAITVIYHVGLLFAPVGAQMRLYLSPSLFVIVLLAISELFNCYREFSAFRVVSSKQQKYALLPRISVGGHEGNARLSLLDEQRAERWYVRPIGFVRNYFTNTEKRSERSSYFSIFLMLSPALSLLVLLFALLSGGSLSAAWHAAFVTFLLTMPAVSIFYTSMPMFFGALLRLKRKGAIVGEVPVHEMSDKIEIALSERDCFKSLDHAQFELVKNCDAERSVIMIRALLDAIGSPLAESVHVPVRMRMDPTLITLTDVSERGVAAVVREESGNKPILLGDVAYLQRYGIRVSPKKDGRYDEIKRQMLCVAINGKLTALFVAQYRLREEIEELISLLKEENIGLVIRTKDPGIYEEMLRALVGNNDRLLSVLKPEAAEMDIRTDRVDASVVSVGSAKDAARTVAACRRIRRTVRVGAVWQTISFLLGAGLAATLAFFGRLESFSSVFVTLMALLAPVGHALSSYFILHEQQE